MASQDDDQRKERTGSSAKLPAVTLADALPFAQALHDLAGPASRELIAEHAGMSPAGGAFKTKFATAQYYGLLERRKGSYVLTPLGEMVVSPDEDVSTRARRRAVMVSGFGPLLDILKGRTVQSSVVSARLRADHPVPNKAAERYAEVLMETARDVGLITDDRFVTSAIESAQQDLGVPTPSVELAVEDEEAEDAEAAAAEVARGPVAAVAGEPAAVSIEHPAGPGPAAGMPIQIILTIDGSKLSRGELADIVRELRKSL